MYFTLKQRNDLPRFLNLVINRMIDKNAFKSTALYYILCGITEEFGAYLKRSVVSIFNLVYTICFRNLCGLNVVNLQISKYKTT